MSNALTPEAPETDSAATSVEDLAPGDGTAVAEGSAGEAETKTVDAARFNGLMSAHQKLINELEAERQARAELEARITSQEETPEVADEAVLAKLDALEERAKRAEREAALARALKDHPEAAPFADLIVGTDAEDMENVVAAIAQRASTLKGTAVEAEPVIEAEAPTTPETPATPEAPVIGGGHSAPSEPSTNEALSAALQKGSWADYWSAKTGPAAQANLG